MMQAKPARTHDQRGFTLLETLVALGIGSIAMALIVSGALSFRETYSIDIVRTRINSNLRSAMDIMAMNVRQAGENLLSSFPAIMLTDGASGAADTLTLRRALIPEVLTLCADATTGSTALYVSAASLSNSECVAVNVAPIYQVFQDLRSDSGGTLRIYIYNSATKEGEFLNYTNGTTSSGQYLLVISALSRAYAKLTSSIYVIEEYKFGANSTSKSLELTVDGKTTEPRPVAFDISQFQTQFIMEDNTTLTSLTPSSAKDWKDIRRIEMTLSGTLNYKGKTYASSITSSYFPRNVLSYEG